MSNELQYYGDPSTETGLTVVARVYDIDGSQVGTDVSCSEVGSLAIYHGDMPTADIGEYGIRFFSGSILLGSGCMFWDGQQEVDKSDLTIIENNINSQNSMKLFLAALVGKLSGAETTNIKMRDTADTKNRINATVDVNGNRTAITLDVS